MNGLGQRLSTSAKQNVQQTAKAIAQQVRQEGIEAVKSTQAQLGMQVSETGAPKIDYNRQGFVKTLATTMLNEPQYNPEENKKETEAKLNQVRSKIRAMMNEEEMKARQNAQQTQEAWQQSQAQINKPIEKPEAPTTIMGKIKKGMGGAARGMKGKVSNMQKGGETRAARSKD